MEEFAGYRIERPLGEGGTAHVYLARRGEEPPVALKVLKKSHRTHQMSARFLREIQAMAKLTHPRILRLVDHGSVGDDLWYAMEYRSERNLEEVLRERHADGGSLTIREFLVLARGLGDALAYLHSQAIVHRDLKPENLLVDEELRPTLMDFGLAKDFERSEMTAEGMIMGTPRYMAPEQAQGRATDRTADVYQSGLVLYRALTGSLPLEDENPFATALRRMREAVPPPSRARPNLPPGIDRILLKCLRYRSEERYPDMAAFRAELDRLDPKTGDLLPGQSMPGSMAEVRTPPSGGGTLVTTPELFREAAGDRGDRGPAPPVPSTSPGIPRPRESSSGSRSTTLAMAAVVGSLVAAGALFVATRGGDSRPPPGLVPQRLEFQVTASGVRVYFETERTCRSWIHLSPPDGPQLALSEEPSTFHGAVLDELVPGQEIAFRLQLEAQDGTRVRLPEDRFLIPDRGGGLGLSVREEDHGTRATVQFQTPGDSTCTLRYGPPGRSERMAEARLTGGTRHVFELTDLEPGEEIRYRIDIDSGGTRLSGTPRTLTRKR